MMKAQATHSKHSRMPAAMGRMTASAMTVSEVEREVGWEVGWAEGEVGDDEGWLEGWEEGDDEGWMEGDDEGWLDGVEVGEDEGWLEGSDVGMVGREVGWEVGVEGARGSQAQNLLL